MDGPVVIQFCNRWLRVTNWNFSGIVKSAKLLSKMLLQKETLADSIFSSRELFGSGDCGLGLAFRNCVLSPLVPQYQPSDDVKSVPQHLEQSFT